MVADQREPAAQDPGGCPRRGSAHPASRPGRADGAAPGPRFRVRDRATCPSSSASLRSVLLRLVRRRFPGTALGGGGLREKPGLGLVDLLAFLGVVVEMVKSSMMSMVNSSAACPSGCLALSAARLSLSGECLILALLADAVLDRWELPCPCHDDEPGLSVELEEAQVFSLDVA